MPECSLKDCTAEGVWKATASIPMLLDEPMIVDLLLCNLHYDQIRGSGPHHFSIGYDV